MNDERMCYVARMPDKPGYCFAVADLPEMAKDNAKEIAKLIRHGATIERVTTDAARDGLSEFFAHRKAGSNTGGKPRECSEAK